MLITGFRIITYVLLCGYTPFGADDMKEVIWQTTEARVDFHDRYWKNASDKGTPGANRGLWKCAYLTFVPSNPAKTFIRALLHPNPAHRLTAEQALSHAWLTSFAAPTEHDPCGLHENFNPRARWRNAIGTVRAMSRFAKGNSANNNNKKDHQLVPSSDDEDNIASRSGSPSSRAMPEPESKRQQQRLSPPSPDDRALRGGLAGLVAKGTPKTTASPSSSSPISFSDALNKAKSKAASETEEAREGDAPRAQTATASQPRNMEEEDEDEEEEELHIPGSFDFGDHGGGAARGMPGVATVGRSVRCCWYAWEPLTVDAGEMIVRRGTPCASYLPTFRPSILSTLTVMVTTRPTALVCLPVFSPLWYCDKTPHVT